MKGKKILALFLTAAMTVGSLTACGTKNGENEDQNKVLGGQPGGDYSEYLVTEPITIEFWYNGSSHEAFFNKIADDFNKSQDLITVNAVCGGTYKAIQENMMAALTAGTGIPAMVTTNGASLKAYVDSEVTENLDHYLAANQVDLDDFVKGFIDQSTFDGSLHAMPLGTAVAVYVFNKTELAKHGLDTFPDTWEDYKKWVKDVYEATGKPAITMSALDANPMYNLILNAGGDLIAEDGKTTAVDGARKFFQEYKELVDKGYVEWSIAGAALDQQKFLAQETMGLNPSSSTYEALKSDDFEMGMGWNFKVENNFSTVGGSYMYIPAAVSQAEKNAAGVFLAYLTSAEVNLEWSKFSSYIATRNSIIEDEASMSQIYEKLPLMKTIYEHSGDIVMKPQTTYYDSATKSFITYLNQIFMEGADWDATWKAMTEEMNYTLQGN